MKNAPIIKKTGLFVFAFIITLFSLSQNETIIGTTIYDLQTNGSVGNRIVYNSNKTIQGIWIFSNMNETGTGYNYFNGTSWDTAPDSSIEAPTITGWSEIVSLVNGGEVVIAHNPSSAALMKSSRTNIGSGTWTISPLNELLPSAKWPRAIAGGPDGNTIHLIAHNIYGMVFYSRSLDGGMTWDIKSVQIPGIDSSNYVYLSPDDYAISSNGNSVVVVIFGKLNRTVIAKSTDNGSTWASKQVFNIPFIYDASSTDTMGTIIGISDLNGDQIADTVESTDGSGTVIIDTNGTSHIFYGMMRYFDDVPGDGDWYSDYFSNGIGYWNENMGDALPQFIAGALDLDGSGILLDEASNGIDMGTYYSSLTTMPSSGIDLNGCLYVVYSSIMETLNSGAQFYRHIYGIKSCDGGCTWSYPIDLTPNDDFAECVFPSMAHRVDANFHFIYQKDAEPGLAVSGDEDMFGTNEIIYVEVPATRLDTIVGSTVNCAVGIKEFFEENQQLISSSPNPFSESFTINYSLSESSTVSLKLFDVTGKLIATLANENQSAGEHKINYNAGNLNNGMYFEQLITNEGSETKKIIKN